MGVELAVVAEQLDLQSSVLTVHAVLGAPGVALPPVQHQAGQLVAVGETPARHVDQVTVLGPHGEGDGVAGVGHPPAHRVGGEAELLQAGVVQQLRGLDVYGTLSQPLVTLGPLGVYQTPETWPRYSVIGPPLQPVDGRAWWGLILQIK